VLGKASMQAAGKERGGELARQKKNPKEVEFGL
jgi:hypothetical protein